MLIDKAIERRNKDAVMGLGEHLEELRRRLLWAIIGLLPVLALAMIFGKRIVRIMLQPALDSLAERGFPAEFQNTGPLEFFSAWIKVSMIAALVVGGPWVMYQAWKFIGPGLYARERRFFYILAPLSSILSIAGLAMMYFVMLPIGLNWLIDFSSDLGEEVIATAPPPPGTIFPTIPELAADPDQPQAGWMWFNSTLGELRIAHTQRNSAPSVPTEPPSEPPAAAGGPSAPMSANPPASASNSDKPAAPAKPAIVVASISLGKHSLIKQEYRLREYSDLFFGLALAFVVAFQTPVVVLLLGWAGVIDVKWLAKYRRHAIIACAIIGAAITPTPDPLSMMLIQIPMYLLYELGALLLWLLPAAKVAGLGNGRNGDDDPNPSDSSGP